MNLEDVIDPEYGLQQDEWSLIRPRFGDKGQLEVIGWSGRGGSKIQSGYKLYIVKCSLCAKDPELFGGGVFRAAKGNLSSGGLPCGCSKRRNWSEEQLVTLCTRKAKELGYTFLGWCGKFEGMYTKTKLLCEDHGEWGTTNIHHLSNGHSCPGCKAATATGCPPKPDEVMITIFSASGQFPEGTRFWRSDRLDRRGEKPYWCVYCPECKVAGEALACNLKRGSRPCLCSAGRQQQAYINWIVDDKNQALALKFGIANIAKRRVQQQNRASPHEVRLYLTYIFPTKKQCLAAERECKQTLECGVISKTDMPDGYTETTYTYNLARIKAIYEKHGGKTSG